MLTKIRKAIIPAAGLGTRFLPATKAMPKEMLPIIDKPTIEYIVDEAVAAGIEDIIIVTGKGKRAIEDHFDSVFELEDALRKKGKFDLLEQVQRSTSIANIHYIRQKSANGLGHAVWSARKFIGNEPFAVLLGDNIIKSDTPCIKQLMDLYEEWNNPIIAVQQVQEKDINKYGIIEPLEIKENFYSIKDLVEKPNPDDAPSNLAILGRYILTPEIFEILEKQKPGAGGEIQLTDAIADLAKIRSIFAYDFEGTHYDIGEKLSFIKTVIEFALERDDMKEELAQYLEKITSQIYGK